jgi:hypothetical protein
VLFWIIKAVYFLILVGGVENGSKTSYLFYCGKDSQKIRVAPF